MSASAERGGAETVALSIVENLDRSRFLPLIVFLEDGPLVKQVLQTGTFATVMDSGRVRSVITGVGAVNSMVRLIRDHDIRLVHSHNAKAHIYGGLAAFATRIPSLYHLHGVPRPSLSRDGLVSALSVAIPARVTLACSHFVEKEFRYRWNSKRQIVVVHNGVSPKQSILPAGSSIRREFGIPDNAPLIVMATRLQRWKGVHVFLDAAARVAVAQPEASFIVVGGSLFGLEKDYEMELHQQVERLRLKNVVHFAGFRADVAQFYSDADVVVHCSTEPEPFGMVIIEAMAYGKPVVATNLGGPREIVESGVTGLLVPPRDPLVLAQAILSIVTDSTTRERMGRAGAARVQSFFGSERMVREIGAIYDQVLNR